MLLRQHLEASGEHPVHGFDVLSGHKLGLVVRLVFFPLVCSIRVLLPSTVHEEGVLDLVENEFAGPTNHEQTEVLHTLQQLFGALAPLGEAFQGLFKWQYRCFLRNRVQGLLGDAASMKHLEEDLFSWHLHNQWLPVFRSLPVFFIVGQVPCT